MRWCLGYNQTWFLKQFSLKKSPVIILYSIILINGINRDSVEQYLKILCVSVPFNQGVQWLGNCRDNGVAISYTFIWLCYYH